MTNSRKARIRRQRQRRALLTMALVLVTAFACIGGTIAWLTATTGPVTNTFTVGNIAIDLKEHKYENGELSETVTTTENTYKAYPGAVLPKDPFVTVKAKSEDCYVFVSVDNGVVLGNDDAVATLDINTEYWTKVGEDGNKAVYQYKEVVTYSETDQKLTEVFTKVTIDSAAVTKENIGQLANDTIVVNAYAHQANAIDEAAVVAAALQHFGVTAVASGN